VKSKIQLETELNSNINELNKLIEASEYKSMKELE